MSTTPSVATDSDRDPIRHLLGTAVLTADALSRARRIAAETDDAVEVALTRLGLVTERDMAQAFAASLDLPLVDAADLLFDALPLPGLSPAFLRQFCVLPIAVTDDDVALAMGNPSDDYAAGAVALFAGLPVLRHVALPTDLNAALDRLLADAGAADAGDEDGAAHEAGSPDLDRLREAASDAPVIRLVNGLLARAVDERASDVHLEPTADGLAVRLRVDGRLRLVDTPPARLRDAVVSRVKLMAGLDIAERRLPQDGRIAYAVRGQEVDFRVATTPTSHGESVVVRVLNRAQVKLDFANTGCLQTR